MSYQVLARKWRPQNFGQLVGQEHVVAAITNALENNRLHHAYLFTGTRGVGKTTIARIFSKSLNCETGMTATPCGECGTCVDIDQGSYIDLLEIDAASRTKVEDTRDILDNVQYKPTRGRFKVYLIDEVHMLSKHSFNALLKTLEEPPPHVKFLLATTDPQKLPVTILSRCLQFNLKAMSREQITGQLSHILEQEQLHSEPEALAQLARAANGSMRDALSLTDQAIAQGNGRVTVNVVTDMLGLMDKNQVLKLLQAVIAQQGSEVFTQIDHLASQSVNFANVLGELQSLLHQIALTQIVPDACKLETISPRAIYQLSREVPAEQVQLLYQIALLGRKDLPHALDQRSGFEMTIMRMLAFAPADSQLTSTTSTPSGDQTDIAASQLAEQQQHIVNQAEGLRKMAAAIGHSTQKKTLDNEQSQAQSASLKESQEQSNAIEPSVGSPAKQQPSVPEQPQATELTEETAIEGDEHHQLSQQVAQGNAHESVTEIATQPSLDTAALLAVQSQLRQVQQTPLATTTAKEQNNSSADDSLLARMRTARENAQQQQVGTEEQKALHPSDLSEALPATTDVEADTRVNTPESQSEVQQTGAQEQASNIESPYEASAADDLQPPPWATESITDSQEQGESVAPLGQITPQQDFDSDHGHLEVEVTIQIPSMHNGKKVTHASQIDVWSRLIQQSGVQGLTKQLAIHSAMKRVPDGCQLTLLSSQQHLLNENSRAQLEHALSQVWQKPITLGIELGEPVNTPFSIQQAIKTMRLADAKQQINQDAGVQLLQSTFGATIDEASIQAVMTD